MDEVNRQTSKSIAAIAFSDGDGKDDGGHHHCRRMLARKPELRSKQEPGLGSILVLAPGSIRELELELGSKPELEPGNMPALGCNQLGTDFGHDDDDRLRQLVQTWPLVPKP